MASVDILLTRLKELDEALDYLDTTTLPEPVQVSALRGIAIQAMSIFEDFLRSRAQEWTNEISASRRSAKHLPGGVVPFSDRIVQTLPKRFKDLDESARKSLVEDLAKTLASFSNGNVVAHDLFFSWSGSNIQASDVEAMLELLGVPKGWGQLTGAWSLVDPVFNKSSSVKSKMEMFARLRHSLAHDPGFQTDQTTIRAVPGSVRLVALLIDLCISEVIQLFKTQQVIPKQLGTSLKIRSLKKDGTSWAEYGPQPQTPPKRATRRYDNKSEGIDEATNRARHRGEVVVVYDGNEIIDWRAAF